MGTEGGPNEFLGKSGIALEWRAGGGGGWMTMRRRRRSMEMVVAILEKRRTDSQLSKTFGTECIGPGGRARIGHKGRGRGTVFSRGTTVVIREVGKQYCTEKGNEVHV